MTAQKTVQKKKPVSPKPLGRPRGFDVEQALDAALEVFWQKGYEGASLSDLTGAMGINPPSLYAAFGNKEGLFRQALDRYVERQGACARKAFEAATARETVEHMLNGAIEMATSAETPRGCLLVQGAMACGDEADPIKRELAQRRHSTEVALRKRFERAREEGDLKKERDPADLARYVMTVLNGLAVMASGGGKRRDMQRVASMALGVFD